MLKLLLGGSPCTHWSIAQTRNRETRPEGMGWELFKNYLIARDKFCPDYFLYENNKSMSPAIREQISRELGVEPILINSALLSAQNRQRLYWTNIPNVKLPEDRGILLRDVLESGVCWKEKAYTLRASAGAHSGTCNVLRNIATDGRWGYMGAAEPVGVGFRNRREEDGKLHRRFETHGEPKSNALTTVQTDSMVAETINTAAEVLNINPSGRGMNGAVIHINGKSRTLTTNKGDGPKIIEPERIGTIENDAKNNYSRHYRVYSPDGKSVAICGNGGGTGARTGLYAAPLDGIVRVGTIENDARNPDYDSAAYRVYSAVGKSVTIKGKVGGAGAKTGLYMCPVGETQDGKAFALTAYYSTGQNPEHTLKKSLGTMAAVPAGMAWRGHATHGNPSSFEMRSDGKSNALTSMGHQNSLMIEEATAYQYQGCVNKGGKVYPVYEVRDGRITIKGRDYPIRLADGWYIIRKLTVRECMRLQTVPEDYIFPVSDTQAYKMLGNGWTVDVIAHILSYCPGIATEPLAVLSMYDGMSCGHIALDKLGANIAAYWATEIDKYAIQTTQANYPNIVQLGDAFQVRQDGWEALFAPLCRQAI